MSHCDKYLDDPNTPKPLWNFLEFERRPAIDKIPPRPVLYATTTKPFYKVWGEEERLIPEGKRVRVVMASRMGDVGITEKLDAEYGYSFRVWVDELIDFSESP